MNLGTSTGSVAATLGFSSRTILRFIHEGKLKAHRVDWQWRIFPEDVNEFLARRVGRYSATKREDSPFKPPPVRYLWETRRCWICGRYGACEDREPEVELAEVAAELRADLRALMQGMLRKTA